MISKQLKYLNAGNHRGFSLIELMVTIGVASILVAIAVPSFTEFVMNNRLVTQTNAFSRSLSVARSEAINRAAQVTICKSPDGLTCTAANNWEQGWVIFQDVNGDGDAQPDELVGTQKALPSGYTLRSSATFSNWIAYTQSGASVGSGGNNGDFRICTPAQNTAKARSVIVSITGRARVAVGNTIVGFTCP